MTTIVRYDPLTELERTMDRWFEDSSLVHFHPYRLDTLFDGSYWMPVDIYETPENVVVKASLPGVNPKDVDISVSGDVLTIKGRIKEEEKINKEDYVCRERRYGSFSRSIELPGALRTDKVDATFENGVLTLTIPRGEEAKPRQIKVRSGKMIEGKKD